MHAPKSFRPFGVVGLAFLLAGCELKLDVILYNNTDTAIIVGPASPSQQQMIAPHTSANVNKYWEMAPTIMQWGATYRYHQPTSALPPEYSDRSGLNLIRRFEFNPDHRIYILPKASFPTRTPPPQPADFPLVPQ